MIIEKAEEDLRFLVGALFGATRYAGTMVGNESST